MAPPTSRAPVHRGAQPSLAHLPVTEHVLEHHHGVVHHHAGGKGQARQHDDVERGAEGVEHYERGDDGHRNRHRHNDDAGQAPQEQQQHQHRQGHGEVDVSRDQADGVVDVVGLVIDHLEADALVAVALLQPAHGLPDAVHDLHGVGSGTAQHAHAEGGLAVDPNREVPVLVAKGDAGYVPYVDGPLIVMTHHHVADVMELVELAQGAHQVPALALAQVAALDVAVLPDDGLPDIGYGDAAGRHGPGIQRHVHLSVLSAEAPHRADPGNPLDLRHDDVLQLLPHPVEIAVRVHHDPRDRTLLIGVDGADRGLAGVRRQVGGEVELLGHSQPRHVLVGTPVELEDHCGFPLDGGGGDLLEPRDGVELLLQPVGHLALHLHGRGAAVLGLHRDLGPVHRGDHLDGKAQQGDGPEEHRQDDADGHRDRIADAEISDPHSASTPVVPARGAGARAAPARARRRS